MLMNLPVKMVPDSSVAASALPALKKGSRQRGLAVMVSLTFLLPMGICFMLMLMEESIDAEMIIAQLIVGLIIGSVCGYLIQRFYSSNAEICCAMVNAAHINVENDHISGVALQSLIPNAVAPINLNTFYGKTIKTAEFDISYRQITNMEVFDLNICGVDFGKCCSIYTVNLT